MTDSNSRLADFTEATFSPYVGQTFRIGEEGDRVTETRLVETSTFGPGHRRAQFSLVFRAPEDVVLPQRIYRVEHHQLGVFELFLVPIGPDGEGMRYEAVFT